MPTIRDRLRRWLARGFWFPFAQRVVSAAYETLSLNRRFNTWLAEGDLAPPGASELYQAVGIAIALVWLALINHPLAFIFTQMGLRTAGWILALYRVGEIFLFALNWTFVDEGPIVSVKRSLATLLVSLVEVSAFFSVAFLLADCVAPGLSPWGFAWQDLRAFLQLGTPDALRRCGAMAGFQVVVSATLLTIVLASVIGGILRKDLKSRGAA